MMEQRSKPCRRWKNRWILSDQSVYQFDLILRKKKPKKGLFYIWTLEHSITLRKNQTDVVDDRRYKHYKSFPQIEQYFFTSHGAELDFAVKGDFFAFSDCFYKRRFLPVELDGFLNHF